jgi:hypothetical protein
MISTQQVQEQLKAVGASFTWFGRPEVRELPNILMPGEQLVHCLVGWHQGAIALLCATDQRLLIIDKRPLLLNIEDLRYEMIIEVDYAARILDAGLSIHTSLKQLHFRALNQAKLRRMRDLLQERILAARQQLPASPNNATSTNMTHVSPLLWRRRPAKFNVR